MSKATKELREFRHSLASPLTTLLFGLKQAEENAVLSGEAHQKSLQIIHESALEIKNYFQLRDDPFSSHKEVFSLRSLLQKTFSCIKKNYLLNIKYDSRQLPASILLYGDPRKFQIALTNLINNSAESYADSIAHRPIEVKIIFDRYFNRLKIIIADHGLGINFLKLHLVQSSLNFSFKKIRSGLGLHLTRKIIEEEFAGKFCLTSAKNYGTVAIINLHYANFIRSYASQFSF